MKNRRKRCFSNLALTVAIALLFGGNVWADEKTAGEENAGVLSENLSDNVGELQYEDGKETVGRGDETVSADLTASQNGEMPENLSEEETDIANDVSDNEISSNAVSQNRPTVSDNHPIDEELRKKAANVILPTDIPFSMILWNETEEKEGVIYSDPFGIENKGYEDVRITVQGICRGANGQDYVMDDDSVKEKFVQGKKNVWFYLKWQDADGEEIDLPEIVMRDDDAPGEGEIILKAPKRDRKGNIIKGKNPKSKIYFSFAGDLRSDNGEAWEDGELEAVLHFSMEILGEEEETADSQKTADTTEISEDDQSGNLDGENPNEILDSGEVSNLPKEDFATKISENEADGEKPSDISENEMTISENRMNVSENES